MHTVEPMAAGDWPEVARIFAEGIATGDATFETAPPSWADWDRDHLAEPRLVVRSESGVLGWAALSAVSSRCVYEGVAEVSVYVSAAAAGRGIGTALLGELCTQSENAGIWTLQAGIFPENDVSLRLHARCGFREVGRRERIGRQGDRWRDVLLLERRSPAIA